MVQPSDDTLPGILVCPFDHSSLQIATAGYACARCGREYPIVDGITVFEADKDWDRLYLTAGEHYTSEIPFELPPGHEGFLPLRGDRNFGVVLDAGCGDGVYSTSAPPGTPVFCVDVTMTGLRRLMKRGRADLRAISASIFRLPFPNDSFDTVLFIFVIEHLPPGKDLEAMVELRRVVKDGGRVLVTTDTPFFDRHLVHWTSLIFRRQWKKQDHVTETGHINLLTLDAARELSRRAGFEVVSEEPGWMGYRFGAWRLVAGALRAVLPRRIAEDYLTSSYTLVLAKGGHPG